MRWFFTHRLQIGEGGSMQIGEGGSSCTCAKLHGLIHKHNKEVKY